MGLAASQCRFLAITARKAGCELESMRVAHEKLSVTRDMSAATDNYQAALNQTKLVWDTAGLTSDPVDLTYGVMMKPSPLNDYTPYLVTDRGGQVVLNSAMAKAMEAAFPDSAGKKNAIAMTSSNRNKFLLEMANIGELSPSMAKAIVAAGEYNYSKSAGVGGLPLDKTQAFALNINNLTLYADNILKTAGSSASTDRIDKIAPKLQFSFGSELTNIKTNVAENSSYVIIGGDKQALDKKIDYLGEEKETAALLTLSDLLDTDVIFATTGEKNGSWFKKAVSRLVNISSLGIVSYQGMKDFLGFSGDDAKTPEGAMLEFVFNLYQAFDALFTKDQQSKDTQALDFAFTETLKLLEQTAKSGRNSNVYNAATSEATKHNGWAEYSTSNSRNIANAKAISLSNLTKSFLTYYAQAMGGYDTGYDIATSSFSSNYVTDDLGYYYIVDNAEAVDSSEKDLMYADFYNMMFNNICMNGWITIGANVDDPNYLQHAIKNGQLFVSAINNDGFYYQDKYAKIGFIAEVTDYDAITKAEAEFTSIKAKLNFKEGQLDLKMKNLDMEISTLTTEYDSVKNLIGKNVEKVFSMFQ